MPEFTVSGGVEKYQAFPQVLLSLNGGKSNSEALMLEKYREKKFVKMVLTFGPS